MPLPSHVVGGTIIASAWGNAVVDGLPQIGFCSMWVGDAAPIDYLFCRGQAVSRTTYADLWNLCKTGSPAVGRFGNGDGTTTFNLPDLRGRYPFGHNVGGTYGQVGVGQTFGNKDSAGLVAHQHTGVNHLHAFNVNTGGQSQNHYHFEQLGTILRSNPFAPQYNVRVGDGFTIPIDLLDSAGVTTNWAALDHGHNVAGSTSGADRDLTTGVTGADTTNTNLPPSLSLNFIVRAL